MQAIVREKPIMKTFIVAAALALLGPLGAAAQQTATAEQQIASATHILPQDLRAGATVVTYDAATGARTVLRQGTNFVECQPRMADGFERCYHKSLAPSRDFEAKLRAQKKTDDEIQKAVAAAIKDGTLPQPPKGMMSYRRSEEHTSELQSQSNLVCRLLLEKKKNKCSLKFWYRMTCWE